MYARDHAVIATPIGRVRLDGDDERLSEVRLCVEEPLATGSAGPVRAGAEQLGQWLAGERKAFELALAPAGTERGDALRAGLVAVPYGETLSYGALARLLGSAPRAIGQLCARNPFPVIVPCHRVLGSGGALGNYSGGDGPKTKSWLLEHERHLVGRTLL